MGILLGTVLFTLLMAFMIYRLFPASAEPSVSTAKIIAKSSQDLAKQKLKAALKAKNLAKNPSSDNWDTIVKQLQILEKNRAEVVEFFIGYHSEHRVLYPQVLNIANQASKDRHSDKRLYIKPQHAQDISNQVDWTQVYQSLHELLQLQQQSIELYMHKLKPESEPKQSMTSVVVQSKGHAVGATADKAARIDEGTLPNQAALP